MGNFFCLLIPVLVITSAFSLFMAALEHPHDEKFSGFMTGVSLVSTGIVVVLLFLGSLAYMFKWGYMFFSYLEFY